MSKQPVIPPDFDPWRALDALMGATDAIHWYLTEGPAAEDPLPPDAHASLNGLAWLAALLSRQLNGYFRMLSEAGFEFPEPPPEPDGEVRERAAPYAVN